jgi:hypothetical protein
MVIVYLLIDFLIYFIGLPIRPFSFTNYCEMKFSSELLFINTTILRNLCSKRILNIIMKTRESIVLEGFLFNAMAAIMIRFSRFLISKAILPRYNFSYMRNILVPPAINEEIPHSFF